MKSPPLTQNIYRKKMWLLVTQGLGLAAECHSGQYRKSYEPYIIHPIQVAGISSQARCDAVTVACGFIDVVEDTDATLDMT